MKSTFVAAVVVASAVDRFPIVRLTQVSSAVSPPFQFIQRNIIQTNNNNNNRWRSPGPDFNNITYKIQYNINYIIIIVLWANGHLEAPSQIDPY